MEFHPQKVLEMLKKVAGAPGPQLIIPVGKPIVGYLRPVATQKKYLNCEDINLLSSWRNKYVTAFLNEFNATDAQTRVWLSDVVAHDNTKILFMVDDLCGRTFGYMGIAFIDWELRSGEADAIVRGGDAPKGIMTKSLQTLIAWGRCQLNLQTINVRVRSDNPACEFYRKNNFVESKRVPLRRVVHADKIEWVECPGENRSAVDLLYMTLKD